MNDTKRMSQLRGKWAGQDVYVVGTGSSLMGFNWLKLGDKNCIALNDAIKASLYFIPDFHLFSDVNIWTRYKDHYYRQTQAIICQDNARKNFEKNKVQFVDLVSVFDQMSGTTDISEKDNSLFINRTVATGGIMLAWKLGARRIFLMGVDGYKLRFEDESGQHEIYYHDGTTKLKEKRKESIEGEKVTQDRHEAWRRNMMELRDYFKQLKVYQEPWPGSGVFNLSPASTIDAWQKVKAEDVLGPGCYPEGIKLPRVNNG